MKLEKTDIKILARLQQNCRESIAIIGEQIGLSTSACHRRIKLLEENGFIERYVAQLDARKIGYTMHALVEVSLSSQKDVILKQFEQVIEDEPDIIECFFMAGDADYVLRVAARDMEDFERFHRSVISQLPGVVRVKTKIVFRHIKSWHGYNLEYQQQ